MDLMRIVVFVLTIMLAEEVFLTYGLQVLPTAKNVLFIVADDMRPTIGCYGDKKAITPNLDLLCSHSIRFENAFVQQALCGPSRTSFLTSRRPDTLHLCDVHSYWRDSVGNFTTLPQHFKENGYTTVSFGKVFHPGKASNFTDDYPYSWSEIPYHGSTEKYKMSKVCMDDDGKLYMNLVCPVDIKTQPEGTLPDIQNTAAAIKFLHHHTETQRKSNISQPFFLAIGYHKPHIPLKFPREYLDFYPLSSIDLAPDPNISKNLPPVAWNPWTDLRERDDIQKLNISFPYGPIPVYFQKIIRQGYYAAVTYMDDLLGKLLKELEKLNLFNSTVIIFIGDHGWSLGEHQEWSKYSNFEVSTRSPFMIFIPGVTNKKKHLNNLFEQYEKKAKKLQIAQMINYRHFTKENEGLRSRALVEFVDIFPTLSDIAKLAVPPLCPNNTLNNFCSEGMSLYPYIKKIVEKPNKSIRVKKAAFSQYPRPSVYPQENSDQPKKEDIKIMGYSMRTKDYRYTEWIAFNPKCFTGNWSDVIARELYDKTIDWEENNNVVNITKYNRIAKILSMRLKAGWRYALPSA